MSKYEILLRGKRSGRIPPHVAVQAQIELGFERFLEEKNYQAIVTHFGDLGAFKQLPGLAMQRLMEKGYGFGAEGDWKVAAMVTPDEDYDGWHEGCKGNLHVGGLHLQPCARQRRNLRGTYVGDLPDPSQTARSASSASHCPWVTGKIRQDLYLRRKKEQVLQLHSSILGDRFRSD